MQTIKQKFVHQAPRKLRLVADLVRGKTTDEALRVLPLMPRRGAKVVTHAIKSAETAARQTGHEGELAITQLMIDEGPAMKRRIMISRGRARRMEHRMSHITVTVDKTAAEQKAVKSENSATPKRLRMERKAS